MKTRILSIILAIVMMVGMVPAFALNASAADKAVARLESTGEEFATLQEALNAAKALMVNANNEAQTVTLLDNVNESVKIAWATGPSTANNFNLTIELNGKTVTGNGGSVFDIARTGSGAASYAMTVTFNDKVGTAVVTGGSNSYGGAIYNSTAKGKINIVINGGLWTGNTATTSGGAISSNYTTSTFVTINGGTFTENTAGSNGGAIYARNLTMNGGTITGNSAKSGGGVYVFTAATTTLEMTGGAIYGNTATDDGDDIIWRANRGTASTAYLKLIAASEMGVDGIDGWYKDDAGARYDAKNPVEFTDYAKFTTLNTRVALKAPVTEKAPEAPNVDNADVAAYVFICNTKIDLHQPVGITFDSQYSEAGEPFKNDAGEWNAEVTHRVKAMWENYTSAIYAYNYPGYVHGLKAELPETITVTMKWDSENGKWVLDGEKTYFDISCQAPVARLESTGEEFETLQAALDAAKTAFEGNSDAEKITLLANTVETVKFTWLRSKNITLTIDLAGYTVDGNKAGTVMTFGGATASNGRFNIVIEDSSANKTGTVTGGKATSGGAIKLDGAKSGDKLTINGGNFVGNEATSTGGALYSAVVGARIYINGGNFANNTAKSGGAISAYSLEINGGIIKNNFATGTGTFSGRGGGIQMWGTVALDFKMTGGVVCNNTASRYGDDIVFCSTNKNTASMSLIDAEAMGIEGINAWCIDGYYGAYGSEAKLSDRYNKDNNAVVFEDYADFSGKEANGIAVALKAAYAATKYTVIYTDGVDDQIIFENQEYTIAEGEATPEFDGTPERAGYTFDGWDPEVADKVTEDVTYVAQWTANTNTVYKVKHLLLAANGVNIYKAHATYTHRGTTDTLTNAKALTNIPGYTAKDFEQINIEGDGSTVVTIYYERNYYTLTFDLNGGEFTVEVENPQTVQYMKKLTAPVDPEKTGYFFGGWYTDADLTEAFTFTDTRMPANDLTLYAKWNPNTDTPYTVKHYFEKLDGTYGEPEVEGKSGTTDTLTAAEAKNVAGFTAQAFDQVNIAPDGSAVVEIYYTRNSYTLTFKPENGQANIVSTVKYGATITVPADPTRTGYTFNGWGSVASTMPANDVTYTAQWTANTYVVKFESFDSHGAMADQVFTYDEAQNLNKNKFTRAGYNFVGWALSERGRVVYKDCAEVLNLATDGEVTLYAQWKLDEDYIKVNYHLIYIKDADHGKVTVARKNMPAGSTVVLTVKPDAGYELASLIVEAKYGAAIKTKANSDGTYSFTMPAGQVNVTATFKKIETPAVETSVLDGYTDVDKNAWYADGVEYVIENKLMIGTSGTTFEPNSTLNRAMIVTILWRLEGEPVVNYAMSFTDVEADTWYTEAVRWAASEGIVNGFGDDTFKPLDNLTREQLATILYRYEQKKGGGFTGMWMFNLEYSDAADVSDWAYEAVCWMTMNKIYVERDGLLATDEDATRAEAAVMLQRYCEK